MPYAPQHYSLCHVLHILHHQFLQPWQRLIRPALRVEREHDPVGQQAGFGSTNNVVCAVEFKFRVPGSGFRVVSSDCSIVQLSNCPTVQLPNFIPHTAFPVPSPAGVGQVEDIREIGIEIGFADDAVIAVVSGER